MLPSIRERLRLAGGDHLRMATDASEYWGRKFPFPNWDKVYKTELCPHCGGFGWNDPRNECGFCES